MKTLTESTKRIKIYELSNLNRFEIINKPCYIYTFKIKRKVKVHNNIDIYNYVVMNFSNDSLNINSFISQKSFSYIDITKTLNGKSFQ